jgi:hypothetical protein
LPTPGTATFGEKEVRSPYVAPTARTVERTSTDVSAAPTGSSAAIDTSSWLAAYSGWNCSTLTPSATRAATTSRQ